MEGIGKGLGCAFLICMVIAAVVAIVGWEVAKQVFQYLSNHIHWE